MDLGRREYMGKEVKKGLLYCFHILYFSFLSIHFHLTPPPPAPILSWKTFGFTFPLPSPFCKYAHLFLSHRPVQLILLLELPRNLILASSCSDSFFYFGFCSSLCLSSHKTSSAPNTLREMFIPQTHFEEQLHLCSPSAAECYWSVPARHLQRDTSRC